MLETVGMVNALDDYNVGVLSDTKAFIDTLSRDTSFEAYSQCGELCVGVSDPNNDEFKVHSWNLHNLVPGGQETVSVPRKTWNF